MKSTRLSPAVLVGCTVLATLAAGVGRAQNPPAVEATVVPQAARGTRLQGTAYISRNRKVPGASVLIRRTGDENHVYVTSSDHEGVFQVDNLPDGNYHVEVQREGMAREVKNDIVLRFPFRAVVDLPMEPASAERPDVAVPDKLAREARTVGITGHVGGRKGAPIADIVVRLARWDGLSDPVQTRTAEDGTFLIPELLAGQWRLEIAGVGYLPIRVGLDFEDQAQLGVVLVEQPADYDPSPLELMPPEEPVVPPGLPAILIVE